MKFASFRGETAFLSNMFPCSIQWDGRTFKSSESVYMYESVRGSDICDAIAGMEGMEAKRFRNKNRDKISKDWDKVKFGVMAAIVTAKFIQNPELRRILLEIKGKIVEYNYWHDNYWGICICEDCLNSNDGKNNLGEILMLVRQILDTNM